MATELRALAARWTRSLNQPVDAASLVFFRFAFGALLLVATARFVSHGWVREHYLEPTHFFPFWGLEWLRPLPGPWMYAVFGVMAVCSVGVAFGAFARLNAALLGVAFTYAHAIDKTYYLNHYYLVSLLCFLLAALPLPKRAATVPAWVLWLVRFQIGVVYFYGGVAKLGSDWLLFAQPLTIWLSRNGDVFLIGPLLGYKATAYAMSWAGLLFDLSTPFTLSFKKTRPFAYAAVLVFHLVTARLFQLGMFPVFMSAFALIFFPPDFPRRWFRRFWPRAEQGEARPISSSRIPRWVMVHVVFQLLFPLRALLYPGSSIWTEEGYRYAWHVMLAEKNGYVEVRVVDRETNTKRMVKLSDYLTPLQEKQMSVQPDMLLQFAHMVRDQERARGRDVSVHVRADVSLNGRPAAALIDPRVDLARERDTFARKRWILPLSDEHEPRF